MSPLMLTKAEGEGAFVGIWRPTGRCTVGDTKPKIVFGAAEKGISNLDVRLNSNTDFELSRRHWDFAEGEGGGVNFL